MKKILLFVFIALMSVSLAKAQTAAAVMDKVVSTFKNASNISANFSLRSSQINISGTIVMSGVKYRIISQDYKCWYDGKTQWVYNTATGEVNIVEPAQEELETSNPYLSVMGYQSKYNSVLKSTGGKFYSVELIAKNPYMDLKNILLTIDKTTNYITEAVATMNDGTTQTIKFSNYNKNGNISTDIFVFDNKMVPVGTPVVDLR